MLRFCLIFAVDIANRVTLAHDAGKNYAAQLARIAPDHGISGFTVWQSHGFTVEYGREAGATVEFIATLAGAVSFAADVSKYYGQDSVYLASGIDAVLVDCIGHVETLTHATFAGANIGDLNEHNRRIG